MSIVERNLKMRSATYLVVFCLMMGTLAGCGSSNKRAALEDAPTAAVSQATAMRVLDVSNDTRQLFDVDVIGLLWNGIDQNLKARGLLWTGPASASPYTIEAHIVRYQKGSMWLRNILPMWGKTMLVVKCDLKKEGRVIASVESSHSISIGGGSLTFNAWRKIFAQVSEDIVNQLLRVV